MNSSIKVFGKADFLGGNTDEVENDASGVCCTYFVQCQVTHLIKIGKSTEPRKRLKSLQTTSPTPLKVLTILKEDRESELHKRFKTAWHHNEWFYPTPDLREFIALLRDEDPDRASWKVDSMAGMKYEQMDCMIKCTTLRFLRSLRVLERWGLVGMIDWDGIEELEDLAPIEIIEQLEEGYLYGSLTLRKRIAAALGVSERKTFPEYYTVTLCSINNNYMS